MKLIYKVFTLISQILITHSAHSEKLVTIWTNKSVIKMNVKSVITHASAFSLRRLFWIMLINVKDFLRTFRTCYNCDKPDHFASDCTESRKVSLRDCIQEISNIDKDENKEETEEKVEKTLEMKN